MGEVAPLGDGEGLKISNFIIFSDSRGRLSLQLKGFVLTTVERKCALKTSRWKFFGATFFSKKVANNSKKLITIS